MRNFIFIAKEGYTFQPGSESIEPDIENSQVIGFMDGDTEQDAFQRLIHENKELLDTTFDEILSLELKEGMEFSKYFSLQDMKI